MATSVMSTADAHKKLRPWFTALSTMAPKPSDHIASASLREHEDAVAPLESLEERRQREKVLVELSATVAEWVKDTCVKKGVPDDGDPTAHAGRVFISGSYRMGIATSGADIDAICAAPRHVTREDFFDENEGLMARLKSRPEVTHVLPIQGAFVPIAEVVWGGIDLDVLFAQVQRGRVPMTAEEALDDSVLIGADASTVVSLNGTRVTELIIKLVPNFETFVLVLRCVRRWAKARGIYANKMGFLGGVNWSIMVAFTCQLYPKDAPAKLLARFFMHYATWAWPAPVRLCHPYEVEGLELEQWDPSQDRRQEREVMPIITPAYPNGNSSYNVSQCTLDIMRMEFERGKDITQEIMSKGADIKSDDWASLYEPTNFFVRYASYLSVEASAPNQASLKKWSGWVQSRIRKLVELLQNLPLSEIYPFPKMFDIPDAEEEATAAAAVTSKVQAATTESVEGRSVPVADPQSNPSPRLPPATAAPVSNQGATSTMVVPKPETAGEDVKPRSSSPLGPVSLPETREERKEKGEAGIPTKDPSKPGAVRWFVGIRTDKLQLDQMTHKKIHLTETVRRFLESHVLRWDDREEGMAAEVKVTKWKDLPDTPAFSVFGEGGIRAKVAERKAVIAQVKAEYLKAKEDMSASQHQQWTKDSASNIADKTKIADAGTSASSDDTSMATLAQKSSTDALQGNSQSTETSSPGAASGEQLKEDARPPAISKLSDIPFVPGLAAVRRRGDALAELRPRKRPKIVLLGPSG